MPVKLIMLIFVGTTLAACSYKPTGAFQSSDIPERPDYADTSNWAALPFVLDSADVVPSPDMADRQQEADVDVFYIYPTTYTGRHGERGWNADVHDSRLNMRTDRTAIRNQATVFNGTCRVYAPRYRQAHLNVFYTRKKEDATKALALAYQDVLSAFEYYLDHYNNGRPLIIAGHSQGTMHAARLIKDFYEGDSDMPPLIVAYLIGMPVKQGFFEEISPCATPEDLHCFCSWRTVHEKYKPSKVYPTGDEYAVTNPLSWRNDGSLVDRSEHDGAVLVHFHDGIFPNLIEARAEAGLLRISRPKIPGVPVLFTRNYHVADINLFYADLRNNVERRISTYFQTVGEH